jgi:hypothetical protein
MTAHRRNPALHEPLMVMRVSIKIHGATPDRNAAPSVRCIGQARENREGEVDGRPVLVSRRVPPCSPHPELPLVVARLSALNHVYHQCRSRRAGTRSAPARLEQGVPDRRRCGHHDVLIGWSRGRCHRDGSWRRGYPREYHSSDNERSDCTIAKGSRSNRRRSAQDSSFVRQMTRPQKILLPPNISVKLN